MASSQRIEIINLGDELLEGIRVNGHLAYLGALLGRHGLSIHRSQVIRDEPEDITRYFGHAWETADLVITTGGLGPTTDDLTRETVAEVLGTELAFDERVRQAIEDRFAKMGRTMTENNLRQCYVPVGAEMIPNHHGTAPGIFFEKEGKRLVMLPGPPHELEPMMEHQVLPILERAGIIHPGEPFLQLRTVGVGESGLEILLSPVFAENPRVRVAYCAHEGVVDVRLSSPDRSIGQDALLKVGEICRQKLGDDFVCYGQGSIANVVFDHLRSTEKTLSIAESCTGGLLSDSFTNIPGASKVFAGSVVCYNNDAKVQMLDVPECLLDQHGAVSAECAVAMATGAAERFSTDYALSITGFAGPGGGTQEDPIGTIYIGYFSPSGVWSERLVFKGERTSVKRRGVNAALDVLRRKLKEFRVEDFMATLQQSGETS